MNLTPIFSVSEFNQLIQRHLERLGTVSIKGEIARITIKGNLVFLSIKDQSSVLDIFGLTHQLYNAPQLDEGMIVKVSGVPGVYKKNTRFRLMAESIVPQGEGDIKKALEVLLKKLKSEGLFDESRKREVPPWPENIGVITAKNSSAYHDFIKIVNQRQKGITIKVLPVNVQGVHAVASIKKALTYCQNNPHEFDVVVITRGGGSPQDLEAFNDEAIARQLYALPIPCISAVGHEDNWSVLDHVADKRASTPSNAAELVVKDSAQTLENIQFQLEYAHNKLSQKINNYHQTTNTLTMTIKNKLTRDITKVDSLQKQLDEKKRLLIQKISTTRKHIDPKIHQAGLVISQKLRVQKDILNQLKTILNAHHPQHILDRGFAIITKANKHVTSATQLTPKATISITLKDGQSKAVIK